MRQIRQWFAIACGVALVAGATVAAGQAATSAAASNADGLVKVKSTRFDEVYVRTGADFRGYKKVMLNPTEVTFAKNWRKDLNDKQIALLRRTNPDDADKIAEKARTSFDEIFANGLKSAGYQIVTAPGPDVLTVSPRLTDLDINAPDTITTVSAPGRVYTFEAGEATLALEVRDSTTGTLLERIVDHRKAGDRGSFRTSLRVTGPVSNSFNFDRLFDLWAHDSVANLKELKAQSPLAASLTAQQH